MNTNSHGSPIPSESERKQERKRREETGLANSVRGGGAPVRSPVPERTDDDGRWSAAAAVDRECESEAASESRRLGGGGMGIRVRDGEGGSAAVGSGLYMRACGGVGWLRGFVSCLAGPNAPGRLFAPGRARAVPRAGVAAQAWPGASGRARAVPKRRATGRAGGPRAAWPTILLPLLKTSEL